MNVLLKIYMFIVSLSQVYSCVKVPKRLYYLYERGFIYLLQHLLIPITSFNHKRGFYSLLFNCIPYEVYINPRDRLKGNGKKILKYLIRTFNIFLINEKVYSIVKKFGGKDMVEFNLRLFRVYIKSKWACGTRQLLNTAI